VSKWLWYDNSQLIKRVSWKSAYSIRNSWYQLPDLIFPEPWWKKNIQIWIDLHNIMYTCEFVAWISVNTNCFFLLLHNLNITGILRFVILLHVVNSIVTSSVTLRFEEAWDFLHLFSRHKRHKMSPIRPTLATKQHFYRHS
jgi:hypothetical protein